MARRHGSGGVVGSRSGTIGDGVGVAGRRRRLACLLGGRRQVRGRAASRGRHRRRVVGDGSGPGDRRRDLRRAGTDAWPHSYDRHGGRPQGVLDPSRTAPRSAWRHGLRGRPDRRARAVGRGRTRRPICPSRCPGRRKRDLRRPTRVASVAECPHTSSGTRDAARAFSTARSDSSPGASRCRAAGSGVACPEPSVGSGSSSSSDIRPGANACSDRDGASAARCDVTCRSSRGGGG
jgi:hypothetical protein